MFPRTKSFHQFSTLWNYFDLIFPNMLHLFLLIMFQGDDYAYLNWHITKLLY